MALKCCRIELVLKNQYSVMVLDIARHLEAAVGDIPE